MLGDKTYLVHKTLQIRTLSLVFFTITNIFEFQDRPLYSSLLLKRDWPLPII